MNTPSRKATQIKVADLSALHVRLSAARNRALSSGSSRRADSYSRQIAAVEEKISRAKLSLRTPSPPAIGAHMAAGLFAIVIPLLEWFIAGGVAVRRLGKLVLVIGLLVCAVVLGTSPASAWTDDADSMNEQHWVSDIAKVELGRKRGTEVLPVHELIGRGTGRVK